ncbi:MAG: FkbM family methyltransferase [Caldilineaceae bacterium]
MSTSNPLANPDFVVATTIEEAGDGLHLYTFPDGFRCYSHTNNVSEINLIYNEVFVKEEYLGDTLSLAECRYAVDVGANIGIFTLFAKLRNPALIIHAFEPIKATYDVLVKNIELHGLTDVYPHNCALGNQESATSTLTFFPNAAGLTTAYPESKAPLKRHLTNILGKETADIIFDAPQVHKVPSRTLSAVIDEFGIPAIDFLKIDTEGEEWAILQGIAPRHYPIIRQIAAEIHSDALMAAIQPLLTGHGFCVVADVGIGNVEGVDSNNLYATRE